MVFKKIVSFCALMAVAATDEVGFKAGVSGMECRGLVVICILF